MRGQDLPNCVFVSFVRFREKNEIDLMHQTPGSIVVGAKAENGSELQNARNGFEKGGNPDTHAHDKRSANRETQRPVLQDALSRREKNDTMALTMTKQKGKRGHHRAAPTASSDPEPTPTETNTGTGLLSRFAVFGDSGYALLLSFLLFLLSSGWLGLSTNGFVGWWGSKATTVVFPFEGTGPVSDEMMDAFQADGVIAVRGLIPREVLDQLDRDADELLSLPSMSQKHQKPSRPTRNKQFHTVSVGPAFLHPNRESYGFRDVALRSNIPKVAAQLMGLNTTRSMRLMR